MTSKVMRSLPCGWIINSVTPPSSQGIWDASKLTFGYNFNLGMHRRKIAKLVQLPTHVIGWTAPLSELILHLRRPSARMSSLDGQDIAHTEALSLA